MYSVFLREINRTEKYGPVIIFVCLLFYITDKLRIYLVLQSCPEIMIDSSKDMSATLTAWEYFVSLFM